MRLEPSVRRWCLRVRARWLGAWSTREIESGCYERAERLVREALKLIDTASAAEATLVVSLLNTLGMACKYQGKYGDGRRAYLRALALADLGPERRSTIASLYHNLAGLEHMRGRHRRAEPLARHAVAIRERALGADHSDVARDLAALAAIVDGRGRHAEAEALHRRALALFEARGERRDLAAALGNLAACLHAQGKRGEAESLAAQASAMSRRLMGVAHPYALLAAANLAVIRGLGATPPSPDAASAPESARRV